MKYLKTLLINQQKLSFYVDQVLARDLFAEFLTAQGLVIVIIVWRVLKVTTMRLGRGAL